MKALREDWINSKVRSKASTASQAQEADEDAEIRIISDELNVDVSFKESVRCSGSAIGYSGVMDVRYKEPLLDTNWLPNDAMMSADLAKIEHGAAIQRYKRPFPSDQLHC